MNTYRLPKLGSSLQLWFVERMTMSWFVRDEVIGTVSAVRLSNSNTVTLRIQTSCGYEYECARPIQPSVDELFSVPWKLTGTVVPMYHNRHQKAVLIESVLVHNGYHRLQKTTPSGLARDGLIIPGSPPRVAIPKGDSERCHDLLYRYVGGLCPECDIPSELVTEVAQAFR